MVPRPVALIPMAQPSMTPTVAAVRDYSLIGIGGSSAHGSHIMITDPVLAEQMPRLYRAALDALDALARQGHRAEAVRLRRVSVEVYSRGWDVHCGHVLEDVIQQARGRTPAGTPQPRLPATVRSRAS